MSSTTPTVNEDNDLPTTAQSGQWEPIGRELLRARLEKVGEESIRDAFRRATRRIANGDALTKDEIREMRTALEDAEQALTLAARASPETAPLPDPWEFLGDEARAEYVAEVERRKGLIDQE